MKRNPFWGVQAGSNRVKTAEREKNSGLSLEVLAISGAYLPKSLLC